MDVLKNVMQNKKNGTVAKIAVQIHYYVISILCAGKSAVGISYIVLSTTGAGPLLFISLTPNTKGCFSTLFATDISHDHQCPPEVVEFTP
jgi:hypothetical protein